MATVNFLQLVEDLPNPVTLGEGEWQTWKKVVNRPQTENSDFYNVLKIA